jgi:hypothetical protein
VIILLQPEIQICSFVGLNIDFCQSSWNQHKQLEISYSLRSRYRTLINRQFDQVGIIRETNRLLSLESGALMAKGEVRRL